MRGVPADNGIRHDGGNSLIQRALRDSDVISGALLAALGVFIVTEARKIGRAHV